MHAHAVSIVEKVRSRLNIQTVYWVDLFELEGIKK